MKSSPAPSPRLYCTLDHNSAILYKQRLKKFDKEFKAQADQFQTEKDTQYYIVSVVYLNQWREFASADSLKRLLPIPMNEDLLAEDGKSLRVGLSEGCDFHFLNKKIYQLIAPQEGKKHELSRQAYRQGKYKKVPVYLCTFDYVKLTVKMLRDIDYNRMSAGDLKLKHIELSDQITVSDFLLAVQEAEETRQSMTRLWKIDKSIDTRKLYQHIKTKCSQLYYSEYVIDGPGKLIDHKKAVLAELNIIPGEFFVIEVYDSKTFLRSSNEKKCEGCYKFKKLEFECGCKQVTYCTEECQEKDKRFHLRFCSYAQEEQLNKKIEMVFTKRSVRGLAGLSNLGNTCYMNSCLQCLSHTIPLTSYFLASGYETEVNKSNVLGTKGKLAKSYAKFIKSLWCGQQKTFSPYSLKSAVSSINQMFAGYAQHDSQQFFSFIIDGIHEDLNRVLKKPYVQSVESKGRKDSKVAQESWIAHTMRNQSIIIDLMTGQYKSIVVCPDCGKESITFDPFTTVSLPLPEESAPGVFEFYVMFKDTEQKIKKMSFQYTKADLTQWHQKAVGMLHRQPHEFVLYVLTLYEDVYSFESTPKVEILNKMENEGKKAFLLELLPEQQNMKDRVALVTRLSKKTFYGIDYDGVWLKRPFFFKKSGMKGKDIAERVLQFLYSGVYSNSKKNGRFLYSVSLSDYLQKMMKGHKLKLVLKSKKKWEKSFRIETSFELETPIEYDTDVGKLISTMKQNDYELDVRFTSDSYGDFIFENLKEIDDCTVRYAKKRTEDITVKIQQCFQVFQEQEILEAGNEWYCPSCKDHKLAAKQMFIYKAPEILILHLKRFKNKGVYRKEKNQANVVYPHVLDLSQYVIDQTPISTYVPLLQKEDKFLKPSIELSFNQQSPPLYDLYAVSSHHGGLGGGHYTAFAKNNEKWYEFNDNYVSSVSTSNISSSGAYMLFYRRQKGLKINSEFNGI